MLKEEISLAQEQQTVFFEKHVIMLDTHLRNELNFLSSTDLSYATKKLKEQAESHFSRANVKKQVDGAEAHFENGKSLINKICAVYLLRYIRIREFKKKILDIFNYFRSIRRKLVLDAHGYSYSLKEDRAQLTKKIFTNIEDLQHLSDDSMMNEKKPTPTRDDFYELVNNRDIVIRDATGLMIMYDAALNDLEARELELLKIGTYFVQKSDYTTRDINADRVLILEDLYESEAWFQDAKRKLIDSYMEAYDNSCSHQEQLKIAQTILNLIAQKPLVDLQKKYFSEIYAAEIINLELQHTLTKDIIFTQMSDEKTYLKNIYKSFNHNKEWFGMTDAHIEDSRLRISLFPGSYPICFLDFFHSIGHIIYLSNHIDKAVANIVSNFKLLQQTSIAALKRTILQQAIVEWKLLSEEDKLQRSIKAKTNPERKNVEDALLLEDPEELISIVDDLAMEIAKLGQSNKIDINILGGNKDDHTKTEGGFLLSDVNGIQSQYYANMIEMLLIWKNLTVALHETGMHNFVVF